MLIPALLLIKLVLGLSSTDMSFPAMNARYSIDFGQDLKATAVFISDSEMVYGNFNERGRYKRVTIKRLDAGSFAVRWKEERGVLDIEHRYDINEGKIKSRTTDCAGHVYDLKGTFRKVD